MVPESGIKHRNDAGTAGRNHNQTLEEKLPPHRIKLLSWIICTKEGKRECQYHLIAHCCSSADPLFPQDEATCKSKDLTLSSDVTRRQHRPRRKTEAKELPSFFNLPIFSTSQWIRSVCIVHY